MGYLLLASHNPYGLVRILPVAEVIIGGKTMLDILFDLWIGRFDYNEETAVFYNWLTAKGLTNRENLEKIFGKK